MSADTALIQPRKTLEREEGLRNEVCDLSKSPENSENSKCQKTFGNISAYLHSILHTVLFHAI